MGSLVPGATYIYERDGDTVYARELGSSTRKVIGMDYPIHDPINWHDVEIVAKTNKQDISNLSGATYCVTVTDSSRSGRHYFIKRVTN